MKQAEDDKHMRQVDLIAALTQHEERGQDVRTAPFCLSDDDDHHASTQGKDGHIQAVPAQSPGVSLDREAEAEDQERYTHASCDPKERAGEATLDYEEGRETSKSDRVPPSEIGGF